MFSNSSAITLEAGEIVYLTFTGNGGTETQHTLNVIDYGFKKISISVRVGGIDRANKVRLHYRHKTWKGDGGDVGSYVHTFNEENGMVLTKLVDMVSPYFVVYLENYSNEPVGVYRTSVIGLK